MARPLREQFLAATLILLVPLAAVITWAAGLTYSEQVAQVAAETDALASVIAAHIDHSRPEDDANLQTFIHSMQLPELGMGVRIVDSTGRVIAERRAPADFSEEMWQSPVQLQRRPWTLTVSAPTSVAWGRAAQVYRRSLAIAAMASLIMLVMEAFFLRRWLRALGRFERAADRVGSGDLHTPVVGPMPSRELERLREAFAGMVDNLREARASIARQVEEERQMREEVESLQRQIIRQERLAAIGVLLSGIAHELNNPLQTISGFADLLYRDRSLSAATHDDVAIIKKETLRASAIIRNLSRFSRQQTASPSNVHLRDVVASVVELRQRRFREVNVALEVDDQAVQPALAVFTELQQVVLNFVINGEQAMISGPTSGRLLVIRSMDVGNHVRLEVEDTGPGVPPDDESKLFQPFFTTKPVGEGTGLGLSVSYGIIRSFGGTIGYHRGERGGACFFFEIPAAEVPTRV